MKDKLRTFFAINETYPRIIAFMGLVLVFSFAWNKSMVATMTGLALCGLSAGIVILQIGASFKRDEASP
ncbi:hypothetical protein LCGC14_1759410 [marine sediment metagenome]|uniref:Uncharacterized protein n=1 Tax=marine sediment metagenome TaxID=412755 RepID=A0A0F9HNU3_9ZZZZ